MSFLKETKLEEIYSFVWRNMHAIGIIILLILAILSLFSFSEPIDIHNNVLHEIEEVEKEHPSWIEVEDEDENKTMIQIS